MCWSPFPVFLETVKLLLSLMMFLSCWRAWSHHLQVKMKINNLEMFHKYYWADFQLLWHSQELSSQIRDQYREMTILWHRLI